MAIPNALELQVREIVQNEPGICSADWVYNRFSRGQTTKQKVSDVLFKLANDGELEFSTGSIPGSCFFKRPKKMGPAPGQELHDAKIGAELAIRAASDPRRLRMVATMLNASEERWALLALHLEGHPEDA